MGRKYLGRHLCIMTNDRKAKQSSNGVVIIAHGATLTGEDFPLEGGTVYFYCPPGDTLLMNDHKFLENWAGNKWFSRIVSDGTSTCPDYELSKLISYHRGDEYEDLGKRKINKLIKSDPPEARGHNLTNYRSVEGRVKCGMCPYDVVSIRNRRFSDGTTLSYVIKKLLEEGYGYGEIHCGFCRSSDGDRDWDVESEQYV